MKNKLSQATIYLTISSIGFVLSGYIINIFLGRYLGPIGYGIYGIVIALWSAVNLILVAGLPQAVSKYISEDVKQAQVIFKSALNLQIVSMIIISVLYFFSSNLIANLLKDISLTPYIQLSVLIIPSYSLYALYMGYYNGRHHFTKQALLHFIYSTSKLLMAIVLVYFFHLSGVFIGFAIAPLVALFIGFYLPKKQLQPFPYKKLILFSLPLIGFTIFITLQQSIDLFFVKGLINSNKAPGYYTAAQNIAKVPFFGLSAFSLVIFPAISHSVSKKLHERTNRIITYSLRYVLLLLVPGIALISATSQSIISLLYSKAYIPAASPLSILIIGFGFLTFFTILANILNGAGLPFLSLGIAAGGVVISALFCIFLIPTMGLAGAALATTISSLVTALIASWAVYRRFHAFIHPISLLRIFVAAILIYEAALRIQVRVLFLPIVYIILFGLYLGVLILLKEIQSEDWNRLRSFIGIPSKSYER